MRTIAIPWSLLLGLALLLAGPGCKEDPEEGDDDDATADDDDSSGDDDDTTEQTASATFATYNAGLAHGYVQHAEQRRPLQEAALAELDADVVCMQEVWLEDDITALTAATEAAFPHAYRYDSTGDHDDVDPLPPPCDDLTALAACATEHCDGLPPDQLTSCVMTNCMAEVLELSKQCTACLAANIDQPFEDILTICTSEGPPPIQYGGANGLMVLSAGELADTDHIELPFFLIVRQALYARAATDVGDVHVVCTHLTSNLSASLPYGGEFEGYEEEQAAQIQAIMDWIDTKATDGAPVVLMGDFNNGPQTDEGMAGEFPDNYAEITDAGFQDAYVEQNPGRCTWCAANPLVGEGDEVDNIIDHVFTRDLPGEPDVSARRILDQAVEIEVEGEPVETRLSDHYGASAEITVAIEAGDGG